MARRIANENGGEEAVKRTRNPFRGVLESLARDHLLKVECGFAKDDETSDALVETEDGAVYRVTLQKAKTRRSA